MRKIGRSPTPSRHGCRPSAQPSFRTTGASHPPTRRRRFEVTLVQALKYCFYIRVECLSSKCQEGWVLS